MSPGHWPWVFADAPVRSEGRLRQHPQPFRHGHRFRHAAHGRFLLLVTSQPLYRDDLGELFGTALPWCAWARRMVEHDFHASA